MVYAVDFSDPNVNPIAKFSNLGTILNLVIPILMLGAAILLLFMLIAGGFTILTAGKDPEKIQKAKRTFTFAIIGLIIIISSFLIVKLIGTILKIPLPF